MLDLPIALHPQSASLLSARHAMKQATEKILMVDYGDKREPISMRCKSKTEINKYPMKYCAEIERERKGMVPQRST